MDRFWVRKSNTVFYLTIRGRPEIEGRERERENLPGSGSPSPIVEDILKNFCLQ